MKYTKPEVMLFGRATDVVRHQLKGDGAFDGSDTMITYTAPAYEADE